MAAPPPSPRPQMPKPSKPAPTSTPAFAEASAPYGDLTEADVTYLKAMGLF